MKLLLLLLLTASAGAQTWIKVADEATPGAVTLPAGTTYRYGTNTGKTTTGVDCAVTSCWLSATTTAKLTFASVYFPSGALGKVDPAPGLVKALYVAETASAQTVTVGTNSVTVPASPVLPIMTWVLTGCVLQVNPNDGTAVILKGCMVTKQ
jgi:hypothetical protein